mgnify:CR=1 FL=1
MFFQITNKDKNSDARAGKVFTDHGEIETPVFMPVGTVGSVKGVHQKDLIEDIKARIILGNTYHLYLRPGMQIIEKAGGLHRFMNWDRPLLTDSGGYQVFSLSDIRKMKEEGVVFQSHIDGSKHTFTPENVIDTQRVLGSDIMMPLDECTPYPCDYKYAQESMEITHRWLKRGIDQVQNTQALYGHKQHLFPIVQGSVYKDLRKQSAEFIASTNCAGNAIGGLSVGEPEDEMYGMVEIVNSILPEEKPRYLMGVGTPVNILECIDLGIDMFDCVMPTRNGRNGMLFTQKGIINIKNQKWKDDFSMIDPDGTSFVDRFYTKAYLRHLVHSSEILGAVIASLHNLAFYMWLVDEARRKISEGVFRSWKEKIKSALLNRL